ncbi:MAG: NAD(P)-dependent oxidoreductase [Proteobacteria bacterium]|nr:NAD(P)-dependent oxidoreductase [Pseudomonadota bacterium]
MRPMIIGACGDIGKKIVGGFKSYAEYDLARDEEEDIHHKDYLISQIIEKKCDTVIHLAAYPHRHSVKGWEEFHRLNVLGTKSAYGAACAAGVKRFVYASSGNIYCFGDKIKSQDSLTPPITLHDLPKELEKIHPYPRSKIMAERWLSERAEFHNGVPVIALRINWIETTDRRAPAERARWFNARLTIDRMREGFAQACRVDMGGYKFIALDLIERNEKWEGSIICSELLFGGK